MENYFEPVLSAEQMAAYLDGMLSTEESNMVEGVIELSPDMMEIQEMVDTIDSTLIYEIDNEIPIECLADDFSLPEMNYDSQLSNDLYNTEEFLNDEELDDSSIHHDESSGMSDLEDSLNMEHNESYLDDYFGDLSL